MTDTSLTLSGLGSFDLLGVCLTHVSSDRCYFFFVFFFFFYYFFFFFFLFFFLFFFNDTATTEIYTLSLHDALPILMKMKNLRILEKILELV